MSDLSEACTTYSAAVREYEKAEKESRSSYFTTTEKERLDRAENNLIDCLISRIEERWKETATAREEKHYLSCPIWQDLKNTCNCKRG